MTAEIPHCGLEEEHKFKTVVNDKKETRTWVKEEIATLIKE